MRIRLKNQVDQWVGRHNSRLARVVDPLSLAVIPPDWVRARGYKSGHGPVWTSAPIGALVLVEDTRRGDSVAIVAKDGSLNELSAIESLPVWRAFRARYGQDAQVGAISCPPSLSEQKLAYFSALAPNLNLGRYVKVVHTPAQLPAPVDEDYAREHPGDYTWSSYRSVRHYDVPGWRLAVVEYSHQPFHSNKYTVACRLK